MDLVGTGRTHAAATGERQTATKMAEQAGGKGTGEDKSKATRCGQGRARAVRGLGMPLERARGQEPQSGLGMTLLGDLGTC